MRGTVAAAWACAAAAVTALAGALVFRALDPEPASSWGLAFAALSVPALATGLAIARRRPGHPVGAIVCLLGLFPVGELVLESWAGAAAAGRAAGTGWAVALLQGDWVWVYLGLAGLLLLFPDGRPPGPRWRAAPAFCVGAGVATALVGLLGSQAFDPPYEGVPRPAPLLSGSAGSVVPAAAIALLLAGLLVAAAALVTRFRRAVGVERVQLKWLAAAATLLPASLAACLVEAAVLGGVGPVTAVAFVTAYLAILAAVAVAMLRHGLYDVDRLISRTIAGLVLTVLVVAAFAGIAVAVAVPLGGGSAVGTGVATLAVTLAFTPLRRRVQAVVDRRFDRDRLRAVEAVEAFAGALRDGRAEPEDVEEVLRRCLADPDLSLLVWLPDAGLHADVRGVPRDTPAPGNGRRVTAIERGGAPLAVVVHDPRADERPGLLDDVLRAAALPVEVARLRCQLHGQLEEVRESRTRIVRAGYEERRRLERDLHDGAQQRLVALGMALRRVQRRLSPDVEAVQALDAAVGEVASAVVDLREIARGLRPGALDQGLDSALAELARRTPVAVEVEGPGERLPADVETAAYYVVSEAIANAVKHGDVTRVSVRARRGEGGLVVSVTDDGRGGVAPAPGGGLAGLADRVAAHGGALVLDSPAGAGTRLEVVLPCAS